MGSSCVNEERRKKIMSIEEEFILEQQAHKAQNLSKQHPIYYTQSLHLTDDNDLNLLSFEVCSLKEQNLHRIRSKQKAIQFNPRSYCSEIVISTFEQWTPKSILRSKRAISIRSPVQEAKSVSFCDIPIQFTFTSTAQIHQNRISQTMLIKNN